METLGEVDDKFGSVSKYYVRSDKRGGITDYLRKTDNTKTLYEKQYSLIKEWENLIFPLSMGVLGVAFVFTMTDGSILSGNSVNVFLRVFLVTVIGLYVLLTFKKRIDDVKEFNKIVSTHHNDGEDFKFSKDEYDTLEEIEKYEDRLTVLKIAKEELGECNVTLIHTPLINLSVIPKGLVLCEALMFEKGTKRYQIAFERDTGNTELDNGSYMLIRVYDNPVLHTDNSMYQIIK